MAEGQLTGYSVTTTTEKHIHTSVFCHNRISDLISNVFKREMLVSGGIKRIEVTPQYAKKSTEVSEKSEKCADQTPTRGQAFTPAPYTPPNQIVTEQGILITFGKKGGPSFSRGPM